MICPIKNMECPEHNKKNGCAWWLEIRQGDEAVSRMRGCVFVLQNMLLAEQINMTALLSKENNAISCEISALRNENREEHVKDRELLFVLTQENVKNVKEKYIEIEG